MNKMRCGADVAGCCKFRQAKETGLFCFLDVTVGRKIQKDEKKKKLIEKKD